jgi:SAM-dependent methyltransferase
MENKKPDIDYFTRIVEPKKFIDYSQNNFKTLQKYGTRLDRRIQFYLKKISMNNQQVKVLDLGCGSGGNKDYLASIGIKEVVMLDIDNNIADLLGDAHNLPFKSSTFDLVLATAVTEHLYNPFIAYKEIRRILRSDGILLATVSFWEKWHDNSYFHCTPSGIHSLCQSNDFELVDIWSGWGFINSVVTHAVSRRLKVPSFYLQLIFDKVLRIVKDEHAVVKHRFKTNGSFGFYARPLIDRTKI